MVEVHTTASSQMSRSSVYMKTNSSAHVSRNQHVDVVGSHCQSLRTGSSRVGGRYVTRHKAAAATATATASVLRREKNSVNSMSGSGCEGTVNVKRPRARNTLCFAHTPLRPKPNFDMVQKNSVDRESSSSGGKNSYETGAKESIVMVQAARALMQKGNVLTMKIMQEKRSGYLVRHVIKDSSATEKGGKESLDLVVNAFLPTSQLNREKAMMVGENNQVNVEKKANLVGSTVDVLITVAEMTLGKPRIIVSERAARGKAALRSLEEGQTCYGVVTGLTDFGAFVALKDNQGDFNGAEGLVHVSEISWDRIKHPSEKLNLGQSVDVSILSIDLEAKKITLSLKNLERDPLKETIESVMANEGDGNDVEDVSQSGVIEGFEDICDVLVCLPSRSSSS